MKFGVTYRDYLLKEHDGLLENCSYVEYKRLKKVLKSCRSCQRIQEICDDDNAGDEDAKESLCQCESCPLCEQAFFAELTREASEVVGFFGSRVRHLLHLHIGTGAQRYLLQVRKCFKNDHQTMVEEGKTLIEYATMNAIAIRKILKKYDKVHSSRTGKDFRSKLRSEHIELLQSPWLIELGAFYLNLDALNGGGLSELSCRFSCDLVSSPATMTMSLPDSRKLEYDLTCAICLETVFNPYALSCGHLFCKMCACSAASVPMFQGLKTASHEAKCPICREAGVYTKAVHMLELDLLVKRRCKDYWKERLVGERVENLKQTKEFWDQQTKMMIGY